MSAPPVRFSQTARPVAIGKPSHRLSQVSRPDDPDDVRLLRLHHGSPSYSDANR